MPLVEHSDVGSESSPAKRAAAHEVSNDAQCAAATVTPRTARRDRNYSGTFEVTYAQPLSHRRAGAWPPSVRRVAALQRRGERSVLHAPHSDAAAVAPADGGHDGDDDRSERECEPAAAAAVAVPSVAAPEAVSSETAKELELALAERAVLVEALAAERTARQRLAAQAKQSEISGGAARAELQRLRARLAGLQRTVDRGRSAVGDADAMALELERREVEYGMLRTEYTEVERRLRAAEADRKPTGRLDELRGAQRARAEQQAVARWEQRVAEVEADVEAITAELAVATAGGDPDRAAASSAVVASASSPPPERREPQLSVPDQIRAADEAAAQRKAAEVRRLDEEARQAAERCTAELRSLDAEQRRVQSQLSAALASAELGRQREAAGASALAAEHAALRAATEAHSAHARRLGDQAHQARLRVASLEAELRQLADTSAAARTAIRAAMVASSSMPETEVAAWERERAALEVKLAAQRKRLVDLDAEHARVAAALKQHNDAQRGVQEGLLAQRDAAQEEVRSLRQKAEALKLRTDQARRQAEEQQREAHLSQKDATIASLEAGTASAKEKAALLRTANAEIEDAVARATALLIQNGFSID